MLVVRLEVGAAIRAEDGVARTAGATAVLALAAATLAGVVAGHAFAFTGATRFAIRAGRAEAAAALAARRRLAFAFALALGVAGVRAGRLGTALAGGEAGGRLRFGLCR